MTADRNDGDREDGDRDDGGRRSEPAALRNREPILGVLRPALGDPATPPGAVLETAAGNGIHACFFAPVFAARPWQSSDREAHNVAAIAQRLAAEPADNLRPPCRLDVGDADWADAMAGQIGGPVAAVTSINMIHIAPWSAGRGLIAGAGRLLAPGGVLFFYGPFRVGGAHTGPGNEAFDASLRSRNPQWGIRDLDEVTAEAASHGLRRDAVVEMPANNLSVVFRRGS